MAETRLILHVKGTEAETRELPKHEVRTAISQGQITHSQLIWSPPDQAWKQAKEWPDLLPEMAPEERFILHVKGTEAETKELPRKAVRAALSHGEITHSQLIWSAHDQAWKQVRELPELLPTQKLAPAPTRETEPIPRIAGDTIIPESPASPVARATSSPAAVPHVRVATAVGAPPKVYASVATAQPKVRVASVATAQPKVRVAVATPVVDASSDKLKVNEEDPAVSLLKWICIGLGVFILLILGGNYLLVDQPLNSNLGKTSYSNVTVHGHFGAFVQPNVIVIHIPASTSLTPDNLPDFLAALARSTPANPVTRDTFARVALTSGWMAQYSFSGYSWKELGTMSGDDKAQLKEDVMERLSDANGQPLMPESTLSDEARQALREQIWKRFVAHFTANR